jgi:hypothetical protein
MGFDGANAQLRAYRNNGNNTFTAFNIAPVGQPRRFAMAPLAVGDSDNGRGFGCGRGRSAAGRRQRGDLWAYRNDGGFGFTQFNVESAVNLGLQNGDFVLGGLQRGHHGDRPAGHLGHRHTAARRMRVYQNTTVTAGHRARRARRDLLRDLRFQSSPGHPPPRSNGTPPSDLGAEAPPPISWITTSKFPPSPTFTPDTAAPQFSRTPRRGNYDRPPLIFDGNTRHGVLLKSTVALGPRPAPTRASAPTRLTTSESASVDAGLMPKAPPALSRRLSVDGRRPEPHR